MPRRLVCECGECQRCKHRDYMRGWYAENANKVRGWAARYRSSNLEQVRASDRRRQSEKWRDPYKDKARRVIAHGVAAGRIVRQPCEVCGKPNAEAHHDDYSRPLDVRWLCRKHHMELHRKVAA